jgi:lipopolysaccharide biosynthesis protein
MKRLAIFAGYDKDSIIDDYVIYYLKELRKVADIVFVYDTEFSKKELDKVKDLTIHQMCEKHGEYDFGSYKRGYLWAKEQGVLEKYDELILCNDSAFGPFRPFKPIFKEMEAKENCDFWGMFLHGSFKSKSYSVNAHIQSYFMVFKENVFNSNVFDLFMQKIKKLENKDDLIAKYEVGLSQSLLKKGFKMHGVYESDYNDTHSEDAINLTKKGFPFLKRSLFDYTYYFIGCSCICQYKKVIKNLNKRYPVSVIDKNIYRVFDGKDVEFVLNRKFGRFEFNLLHRRFIKIRGRYNKEQRYQVSISLLGMRVIKITLAKKLGIK